MAYYYIQYDHDAIEDAVAFSALLAEQEAAIAGNGGYPAYSALDDYPVELINVEASFNFSLLYHAYYFGRFNKYHRTLVPADCTTFLQELDAFYAAVAAKEAVLIKDLKAMYIREHLLKPENLSVKEAYDTLRGLTTAVPEIPFDTLTTEDLDSWLPGQIIQLIETLKAWNKNNRKNKIHYYYRTFEETLQDQLENVQELRGILQTVVSRGGTGLILR